MGGNSDVCYLCSTKYYIIFAAVFILLFYFNARDPESEPKPEFNEEEIRGILEVIASTGKFW